MSSAISLVGGRLFPLLDTKYRIPKKRRESNVNEGKIKLEKKLPRTPRDNGKKSMTSIKVKNDLLYNIGYQEMTIKYYAIIVNFNCI